MADDFQAVPGAEWWRTREDIKDLRVLVLLLLMVMAALVVTLLHKGVISWADFGVTSE